MYSDNDWRNYQELYHHGILGQKWYVKNGPPYPLDAEDHNASEKKAGWRDSLNTVSDNIRSTVDMKQKQAENRRALKSVIMEPSYPARDTNGTKTQAAKIIKKNMSDAQISRLRKAGKRLDDAYDREFNSEDPKMEKARRDWAEKEAHKAAKADAEKNGIELGSRWHQKLVESYAIEVFGPMWDEQHPEYSQRNAGKETTDEAFDNYKKEIAAISKELCGGNMNRRDQEKMYWVLDRIETKYRKRSTQHK